MNKYRRRRAKCEELTFFMLENAPDGLTVAYLAGLIDDSTRFRINGNKLGQIMRPHIKSGRIIATLTPLGHSHWKLNDVYIPVVETDE